MGVMDLESDILKNLMGHYAFSLVKLPIHGIKDASCGKSDTHIVNFNEP